MLIFTQHTSSRLFYVLDFILKEQLGLEYEVTKNFSEFNDSEGYKINYSQIKIPNVLQIIPHKLLTKTGVEFFDYDSLGEDMFAFIFFMLSRYEEYVDKERDTHNRFSVKQAFLYRKNRVETPIVDELIEALKAQLKEIYPSISFKKRNFRIQPTIDIDQACKYKYKSFNRKWGGAIREIQHKKFDDLKERLNVLFGFKSDPWNIKPSEYKHKLSSVFGAQEMENPVVFFLLADYGEKDKNLSYTNKGFRRIIKKIDEVFNVGIHPSYASNKNADLISVEKNRLEKILNKTIINSRQHYIKLDLPTTYRNLINAGILNDYSMGFADGVGFRAGTTESFLWYDLEREEITDLRVHPFCFMDVSLKNYLKLKPEQAKQKIEELKSTVKKVNGVFCGVFHNESLSGSGEWKEWNGVIFK